MVIRSTPNMKTNSRRGQMGRGAVQNLEAGLVRRSQSDTLVQRGHHLVEGVRGSAYPSTVDIDEHMCKSQLVSVSSSSNNHISRSSGGSVRW